MACIWQGRWCTLLVWHAYDILGTLQLALQLADLSTLAGASRGSASASVRRHGSSMLAMRRARRDTTRARGPDSHAPVMHAVTTATFTRSGLLWKRGRNRTDRQC